MMRGNVRGMMLGAATLLGAACVDRAPEGSAPTAQVVLDVGDRVVSPSLSADGRRLAYWAPADTGNVATLTIANADFSAPEATPFTTTQTGAIFWAPDGTRLAATVSPGIVIYDPAARTSRRVSSGGLLQMIDWSPSSDRLAALETAVGGSFRTTEIDAATGAVRALIPGERRAHFATYLADGRGILVNFISQGKITFGIIDSTGAPLRALTSEGFEEVATASPLSVRGSVSPDGKELLYRSTRTGRPDLWVVPLAGGPARQLTQDVRADYAGMWTPDGQHVVFLSERGGQTDIWMVPRAGGEARRLTDSPEVEELIGWREGRAELLFRTAEVRSGLVVTSLRDGTERELVADSLRVSAEWALSSDGSLAAAPLERGAGNEELLVVEIATGAVRSRLPIGGRAWDINWSSDDKAIAMSSNRGGSQDIWTLTIGDTAFTRITDWPTGEFSPVFAPDGRSIYFSADRESKLQDLWRVPLDGGAAERLTTAGNFLEVFRHPTHGLFGSVIRESDGALTAIRLSADGRTSPLWRGRGQSFNYALARGDSMVIGVVDSVISTHLIPLRGGTGRVLLSNGELQLDISRDGEQLLFKFFAGANEDLGILDLATGARRTLTRTALEREPGAEFTADPDQVAIRRERRSTRVLAVPLPTTP